MNRFSRRTFVLGAVATAAAAAAPGQGVQAAVPFPFRLGIASGEPGPDSVVLWTRLAPAPLDADGHA